MRLNVSVRDPQDEGASTAVAVDTEPSAQVGRLAVELARAVDLGGAGNTLGTGPVLYIGSDPIDPEATLYAAGVRDGLDLGLGAPVHREPDPRGWRS